MDAVRLILASRHALAISEGVSQTLAEVWQAQALAQAIGSRLAVTGPPELRGEALGLTELAGRGCGLLDQPRHADGDLRAARLTELGDARQALLCLGNLLGEAGIALVGIASAAEAWRCAAKGRPGRRRGERSGWRGRRSAAASGLRAAGRE